jgi:uncharacterized coiled-coil protein SlyX
MAKETAELRASIAAQGAELRNSIAEQGKSIAELRNSIAEQGAELRASIAESRKETAELRNSMAKETAELRNSITEQGKSITEQGKSIAEQGKSIAELRASITEQGKHIAEQGKRIDDLRVVVDRNNANMEKNNHSMGLLTNKLGGIVESIVIPGIVGKFNEKGFSFDSVSTRVEFLNEERDGNLAEVDALLENGKFVIAVETKTELQVSDVNEHIKRLNALRGISRFKGKKIYGALSTAIARKRPVNYALEKGFYVLQQPDVMGVKIIEFPKGHRAKAW